MGPYTDAKRMTNSRKYRRLLRSGTWEMVELTFPYLSFAPQGYTFSSPREADRGGRTFLLFSISTIPLSYW